jgi:hypothetical protein
MILVYKTLHRKLKIEQNKSNLKQRMNLGAPEGFAEKKNS